MLGAFMKKYDVRISFEIMIQLNQTNAEVQSRIPKIKNMIYQAFLSKL